MKCEKCKKEIKVLIKVVEWNNPFADDIQECKSFRGYPAFALVMMIPIVNSVIAIAMFIVCLLKRKVYYT